MNRLLFSLFALCLASCVVAPRQRSEPCTAACECDTGLTCASGSCAAIVPVICSPGVSTCEGGNLSTCNSTGTGAVRRACPLTCLEGACVETLCEPAESTCFGTRRATCNEWGLGWNVTGACD